jgi:hypothetical protein
MRTLTRAELIENARTFWKNVALENDWYYEPFYVQVWFDPDDNVYDAVSTRHMTADIIIDLSEEEIQELESDD